MAVLLLDTTVLVAHERGDETVTQLLPNLVSAGHMLGTTCVNLAEYERGAIIVTDNAPDFPMKDVTIRTPDELASTSIGGWRAGSSFRVGAKQAFDISAPSPVARLS